MRCLRKEEYTVLKSIGYSIMPLHVYDKLGFMSKDKHPVFFNKYVMPNDTVITKIHEGNLTAFSLEHLHNKGIL